MKRCIIISALLSFCIVNVANSTESNDKLEHAVYVAFQATEFFTNEEITAAQQLVIERASNGDEVAKYVAPKLSSKLNGPALAQR